MPTTSASSASTSNSATQGHRVRREVLKPISGLLLGLFVSVLSSTLVSTALPRMVSDLHGDQAVSTWIVTATLLTTTVSTPIWGKLADRVSRKALVQVAILAFAVSSIAAALAPGIGWLIAFRAVQGIGAGGLIALAQVVIADLVSPRERGRYMGLFGGVIAVATVGGPLIGGATTEFFGWRWTFFLCVPFAVAALVVIQRTLHLNAKPKRSLRMDYAGAALLTLGVSSILIRVSLPDELFPWASWPSWAVLATGVTALVAAVLVETRAQDPVLPLTLFRQPTFVLVTLASVGIGAVQYGSSVFLSQFLQLAAGATAAESGLLTLPMVLGTFVASTIAGRRISHTGRWKRYIVSGAVVLLIGVVGLGTIRADTPYWVIGVAMTGVGVGIGMTMQNLVLVAQNALPASHLGIGSAAVSFFRSLAGAIALAALGGFLAIRVSALGQSASSGSATSPSRAMADAFGHGIADVFLVLVPFVALSLVLVACLPNRELGTKTGAERLPDELATGSNSAEP